MSCLRRSEFVALPELEGVGAALRLSYPGMDTTGGHAVINGLIWTCIWSRLACRTWSCTVLLASRLGDLGQVGLYGCIYKLVGES